jgi:SAM-dependent methyltransferase
MLFRRKRYGKDYFESGAYRQRPSSPRNRHRLEVVLDHKRAGRLLEIGPGTGAFLRLAARRFEVEGLDISKYAVRKLRAIFGARVRRGNIEAADIDPGRYDVIVGFNVLEHLRQPRRAVQSIYHGLKRDGVLIGSVPHNYSLVGSVHAALTDFFDKTHHSTLPTPRWRRIFKEAGFREVNLFGELMLGKDLSWYVHKPIWKHIAFNLMFVCCK